MAVIDLSHTSHTTARTGIQRVCRSLFAELRRVDPSTSGLTLDPYQAAWRALEPWELENLSATNPSSRRSAQWPLRARVVGRLKRHLRPTSSSAWQGPLFVPEIFSPTVAAALPGLFKRVQGPRLALFHDAIPLKFPEFTPAKSVARFPAYLHQLARFDGVAAVSEDSRRALEEFWAWSGVKQTPPLVTLPLGVDTVAPCPPPPSGAPPVLLCVSTLERRKNHLALFDACEQLWSEGLHFQLEIVGMVQRDTGRDAAEALARAQARGRPLRFNGPVSDTELAAAYARSTFTVYPSLVEGFGLPVLEALARGRPCVCSGAGALGEVARGGGCLTMPAPTKDALVAALKSLLLNAELLQRLTAEARIRSHRTWSDYTADLMAWSSTIRRRG